MTVSSRSVLVAALFLGLAGPLSAQARRVTLEEAITRAAAVQPLVVQAEGQVRNSGARIRSAKGAYLPNLNANASGSDFFSENTRIDPSTGQIIQSGSTSRSVSTSLSSNIELFDGFRRSGELNAARASDDAALASLADARFRQALTTTGTFFDALSARQLVRVREQSVTRAEEQLKTSVAKLRAGSATRSDSLRAVVGVGNAQLQLLTAQAQLASAEANLGRLIGEAARVEASDDSAYYRVIPQIDTVSLRTEALTNSPQVQSADASARASEAAVKTAKAGYWPSLSLTGSTSLNGTRSNDFRMLNQRQLSLGFNWQLFNRFTREQNIVSASTSAETARATAEETRRAVQADLTTRLAELEAARLRIVITQRSVEASQEDLRVQQERYRLGVSTILDVLLTTEQLNQAEVDAVNARFDYLRAKANIEALIGRAL
jgi:outer membrane protein TolC